MTTRVVNAGLAAVALLAVCALVALGCGAPRSGAVAETGPCAQVIPLAQSYANRAAKLTAVRALKRGQIRPVLTALDESVPPAQRPPPRPRRRVPAQPGQRLPTKACLMIYSGRFAPGGALKGYGPGPFLNLVIRVRHPQVVRAVVTNSVPRAVARER